MLFATILILATVLIWSLLAIREVGHSVRWVALLASLISLVCGALLWISFNRLMDFQYISRLDFFAPYNIFLAFGLDGLSVVFLMLTLFIMPLCFVASWTIAVDIKEFVTYLLLIEVLLILTFTTIDLFYFYVFFESILIPMFILIGRWGARERKIKAAYYFFLYTLLGSLFMLFGLFYLYLMVGSTHFFVLADAALTLPQQKVLWLCFFMAFAVKIPMFPFHIWLPEAHVEAPTIGSVILASLLLKLGGYGFLRVFLTLLPEACVFFAPLLQTLSLLGVIYASLSTIRQIDMKRIIAYSSIAHMNLVMLGLFSNDYHGVEGAIYLMLAHGVVSSAMFFCVGVLYDRYHTRLLRYYGGLATVMPVFAVFFLSFSLANMSLPGTCNFIGEFLVFVGLFGLNKLIIWGAATSVVLSAVYSLLLFNRTMFGALSTLYINRFSDLSIREFTILSLLFLPMLVMGVNDIFISSVVEHALEHVFM